VIKYAPDEVQSVIDLGTEDFIVRSVWQHLRCLPDTCVVLVDDHQVEFWRPLNRGA
jgi:hypothetical protein